jgi:hypothetical protein
MSEFAVRSPGLIHPLRSSGQDPGVKGWLLTARLLVAGNGILWVATKESRETLTVMKGISHVSGYAELGTVL